jgi:hypothetical protein
MLDQDRERLQQAMLDEAASHGANKADLKHLQNEFQKAWHNKPVDEDIGIQAGSIPS